MDASTVSIGSTLKPWTKGLLEEFRRHFCKGCAEGLRKEVDHQPPVIESKAPVTIPEVQYRCGLLEHISAGRAL